MKRMIQFATLACFTLLCGVCFIGCSDDAIVETSSVEKTYQPFRLTASQETPSRLALGQDGLSVTWEPGDQLVLVKKDRSIVPIYMNAELDEPSTSATFVSESGVPAGEYWVFYNYNDDLAYSHQSFLSIEDINNGNKLVLWGELTIAAGDTDATITLQHLYSKVRVELQNMPSSTAYYQIGMYASKSGFPIYKQFTQSAIIDADYGRYLTGSNSFGYGFHPSDRKYHNIRFGNYHVSTGYDGMEGVDKTETEERSVLLLPADVSDGTVYFYIIDNDDCYEIPKSDLKFDPGKSYKVVLDMANATKTTLNKTEITLPGNTYSTTFYQLTSPEDCRHAAYRGHRYEHYVVMNDIDFQDNPYLPIMASRINGNEKSLKNISIEWPEEDYVGLVIYDYYKAGYDGGGNELESKMSPFGSECTISNLTIENASIKGDDFVGALGGTFIEADNCHLKNTIVKGTGDYVGGLVGYNEVGFSADVVSKFPISRSSLDDKCKIEGANFVGGIVGGYHSVSDQYIRLNSSLRLLKSCSSAATIEATGDYVGGIFGKIGRDYSSIDFESEDYTFSLYECVNTGKVKGRNYVGGIGGSFCFYYGSSIKDKIVITHSANEGNVSGTNYVGGIVGEDYATINLCYSIGDISALGSEVGGILGRKGYSIFYISNCYSMANLTVGQGGYSGGIVGYAPYSASPEFYVENCYFAGTNSNNYGIVGYSDGNVNVTNCLTTLSSLGELSNKTIDIDGDGIPDITTNNQTTNSLVNVTSILQNKSVINGDNAYSDNVWANYNYDCVKFAAGLSGSVVAPGFGTEIIY